MRARCPRSQIPGVACGLHEFRWMCEQGVYDILQPESLVTEGITELRKIGALTQSFGKRVVPHHGGGDLGTIAHLHLVASWPHAPYLELLRQRQKLFSFFNALLFLMLIPLICHIKDAAK